MKNTVQGRLARVSAVAFTTFALVASMAPVTQAAGNLTNKSVKLSNSEKSNTATTYTFTFTGQTATALKCAQFTFSTTQGGAGSASAITGTATLPSQPTNLGATTGWSVAGPTTGVVKVTNATNATTPSAATVVTVGGLTNAASSATYFVQVRTFTDAACTTPSGGQDSDDVAYVVGDTTTTANDTSVNVTANLGETLTLTTNAVTAAIGTLNASNICTTGAASCPTNQLTAATNASNGYFVYGQGSTLSNGAQTIPYITTGSTSVTAGTSGFGIDSTACTSGATCLTQDTNLNTQTSVMTRAAAANNDQTTLRYKAAINNTQAPGSYSTTVNYVATGRF